METLSDTDSSSDLHHLFKVNIAHSYKSKARFCLSFNYFPPSPAACPVSSICVQRNTKPSCQRGLLLRCQTPRDRSVVFLLQLHGWLFRWCCFFVFSSDVWVCFYWSLMTFAEVIEQTWNKADLQTEQVKVNQLRWFWIFNTSIHQSSSAFSLNGGCNLSQLSFGERERPPWACC